MFKASLTYCLPRSEIFRKSDALREKPDEGGELDGVLIGLEGVLPCSKTEEEEEERQCVTNKKEKLTFFLLLKLRQNGTLSRKPNSFQLAAKPSLLLLL